MGRVSMKSARLSRAGYVYRGEDRRYTDSPLATRGPLSGAATVRRMREPVQSLGGPAPQDNVRILRDLGC